MMLKTFTTLICLTLALAGVIDLTLPCSGGIVHQLEHVFHSEPSQLQVENRYDVKLGRKGDICTLKSRGDELDDSYNLEKAVERCGRGGVIRLPDTNYTIARPLELSLDNAYLDLHGYLTFASDTQYWIENHFPFAFQNQSLGFVIKGERFVVDGNGKGGMDGNGQVWYDRVKDIGNYYGRPMSLAVVGAKDVVIKDFRVINPAFWASVLIDTTNVLISNFYVNASSSNSASAVDEKNWLQNTDGIDTYRSHNVTIDGMIYQGGDDCIALKPNSTSITARNVSCHGGTGIAFGSIAQYAGVTDIIEDVIMEDIRLYPSSQCPGYQGVYFKSWIGESSGTPPNGGGGGEGWCRNVTVKDVYMEDIWHPIAVDTDLIYTDGEKGKQTNNGKFEWSNIHLSNFTGQVHANRLVWMDCSKTRPCFDWTFQDINLVPGNDDHPEINYVCNNMVLGGNDGLNDCHPSNSTLETSTGGTM